MGHLSKGQGSNYAFLVPLFNYNYLCKVRAITG